MGEPFKYKYADYMKSAKWQTIKALWIWKRDYKCERCGLGQTDERRLHVHHLNYDRLGYEQEGDMAVLCHDCHYAEHEKMGTIRKEQLK